MPQMAPISWLILFLVFSLTFMIFNMMNYFSFLPSSPKSSSNLEISSKSFNWKW